MLESRALHTATLLANGNLLVAGGLSGVIDLGGLLSGNLGGVTRPSVLATSKSWDSPLALTTAGPALNAGAPERARS